jgi:metal-dependent HD superfamily phosphatase/phosphodiesterase
VNDTAILTPTYPTLAPIRAANGAATINSVVQTFSSCSFDVANVVAIRPSVANDEGATHAIITDRTPTFTIDPEATVATGNDIWADWFSADTNALSLNIDDGEMDQVTFAAPAVQRMTISNGDREGLRIDQQTLLCCRDGANAEFSITFAST